MINRIAFSLFMIAAALGTVEVSANLIATGSPGIGLPAEARVGRPLTPVSVAGVTRRTVRRCAADVYVC